MRDYYPIEYTKIHGGTFGNESLLKKTAAERQLQRLRKRKESTSSTTAQQSRRMDASTQTIVRLTLVASPLELKTPSYKLLLIVKVQLRPYLLNYWEGKLKKCHILKVDERNYFGADLSHILRIKKRILLGREEPYIEKKIIVNLLGQKEPQGSPIVEINVKLKIEKNNKFLIINEYKNKFMNKEEENSYSENESNSSEEETDKTNTTETQVELNKNIEVEKLVEISINTKEDSDSTQRINKEKPKEKSLLDTTVREDSNTGKQELIQEQRIELNVIKETAKEAASTNINIPKLDLSSFKDTARNSLINSKKIHQRLWDQELNNKLHKIKPFLSPNPNPPSSTRRQQVIWTRMKIGHTNISHVHLMRRDSRPNCEFCNSAPISTAHLLLEYSNLSEQRKIFPHLTLRDILTNDCTFFSAGISDISSKKQSDTSCGCKNGRPKQYCNHFPSELLDLYILTSQHFDGNKQNTRERIILIGRSVMSLALFLHALRII
ncbi:hypothetical protein AGLY_016421 [Aphis glycines]|uniref:Uncharacterized protein n=1 Tax=Aphis glycines TaxID=307491 RepID=A0A6G0SYG1_APHGL|nr:hypothetical protein AGLY_016421 [Aphis glycines]